MRFFSREEPKVNADTVVRLTEEGKNVADSGQAGPKSAVVLRALSEGGFCPLGELAQEAEALNDLSFKEVREQVIKLAKGGYVCLYNEVGV